MPTATPMPLQAWLDAQMTAVKDSMRIGGWTTDPHEYDRGYLAALEAVADRLLNEELSAGLADEERQNVRRFGVA